MKTSLQDDDACRKRETFEKAAVRLFGGAKNHCSSFHCEKRGNEITLNRFGLQEYPPRRYFAILSCPLLFRGFVTQAYGMSGASDEAPRGKPATRKKAGRDARPTIQKKRTEGALAAPSPFGRG
jgi:hypothetical protein